MGKKGSDLALINTIVVKHSLDKDEELILKKWYLELPDEDSFQKFYRENGPSEKVCLAMFEITYIKSGRGPEFIFKLQAELAALEAMKNKKKN